MKKTPTGSRFSDQLIQVGDQICFAALQNWEFEQSLVNIAKTRSDDFTSNVFKSNPYTKNINRKIGDLSDFSREAEQISLRMGVIAAVEHVLVYLEEVQSFREQVMTGTIDNLVDDAEEELLRLKIELWSGKRTDKSYFRTLGYLRLLRNHYAHLNQEPHPSLLSYARSHGTPLQAFWKRKPLVLHGLSFNTLLRVPLTFDLAIAIVNLLRVSLQRIDEMAAATLEFPQIVQWLHGELMQKPLNRGLDSKRVASKIRRRIKMEFGVTFLLTAVLSEVDRICHNGNSK